MYQRAEGERLINVELYEADRPTAVIQRDGAGDIGAWARLQERLSRGSVGGGPNRMDVRGDVLLSELQVLREIRSLFTVDLRLGENLQARLRAMAADRREREALVSAPPPDIEAIRDELSSVGFARELKSFQLENLSRIATISHGADFSVPGAGKTTVALANFALQRARGRVRRMLVVAPLAAFASWKEDAEACFRSPPAIAVHLGPDQSLPSTSEILLTNYHRLASDYDRLRQWVAREPTHVVLDEAHRVKKGRVGVHGRAALDLAFAAARRDILSGTPAPQGAYDLVALMDFVYPGQARLILPKEAFLERQGRMPAVLRRTHEAVARYFVRTCKSDLSLPPTSMHLVTRPMGPIQRAIYDALLGRYRGSLRLEDTSRRRIRDLGRIVMYLLEAATNPLLLTAGSDEFDFLALRHEPIPLTGGERIAELLSRYSEYETPWKYTEVIQIVSEAAERGEKVLVWTSFVRNIRHLQRLLAQWNPAIVHGGIPPRDGAAPNAPTTREDELDRFRFKDECSVLLANPAACGEGVSLHHWCHRAVYLDRTFNAGHFLQSQDRIHRLGLPEDTETEFILLCSGGSIDEAVESRIQEKVAALAQLMNDPSLVRVSLPSEDAVDGWEDLDEETVDERDAEMVSRHLDGRTS